VQFLLNFGICSSSSLLQYPIIICCILEAKEGGLPPSEALFIILVLQVVSEGSIVTQVQGGVNGLRLNSIRGEGDCRLGYFISETSVNFCLTARRNDPEKSSSFSPP
jgi:hypothetical protein